MWDDDYAQRSGSCDVAFGPDSKKIMDFQADVKKPEGVTHAQHAAMGRKVELQSSAAKIGVTPDKLAAMREYSTKLRKKHPDMKPDRLKRKVAEYFKIKLT